MSISSWIKKKREKTPIPKTQKLKSGDITTNSTEIKKILRKY